MKRVNIIGINISAVNFNMAIEFLLNNLNKARGNYICAANVHTTVVAHECEKYKLVQNNSFLTLPDGKPLSFIGIRKGYKEMGRVTGPDFLEGILKKTEHTNLSHFFYGTTQKNLDAFLNKIRSTYPSLKIAGFEPSVFRSLSITEEEELIKRINNSKADFVWVALGAPKQEFFCSELCGKTKSIWIAVGGAFNVISGVIPRAPQWVQDFGLEWLFRLTKEPKRLFKRYLETNTKFVFYMIKDKVRGCK